MDTSNHSQVIANEAQLLQAMKTRDADLLDTLLHEDLLFNGPNGQTYSKADDLANYRTGGIHLQRVESSDLVCSEIGDTVVVAVTVQIAGSYMGQEIDGKFRYLRVWKEADGRYQVIAGSVVGVDNP